MKTLFIDTHCEKVTVFLVDEKKILIRERVSTKSHSEIVIPEIESILNEDGIESKDLDEIIVVNGPGSFTGVRIGVTIAKTLAYTTGAKIKTITSLEAYGVSSRDPFDIVTVEDAKGVYCARLLNDEYVDMQYLKREAFESYIQDNGYKKLRSEYLDIEKIIEYAKKLEYVNPHVVNPIYVKEIDALK